MECFISSAVNTRGRIRSNIERIIHFRMERRTHGPGEGEGIVSIGPPITERAVFYVEPSPCPSDDRMTVISGSVCDTAGVCTLSPTADSDGTSDG